MEKERRQRKRWSKRAEEKSKAEGEKVYTKTIRENKKANGEHSEGVCTES